MEITMHDAETVLLPTLHDPRSPLTGAILLGQARKSDHADRIEIATGGAPLIGEPVRSTLKPTASKATMPKPTQKPRDARKEQLPRGFGTTLQSQKCIIDAHRSGLAASEIARMPAVQQCGYTPDGIRAVIYTLRGAGILSRGEMRPPRPSHITKEQRRVIAAECEKGSSNRAIKMLPQLRNLELNPKQIYKLISGERKKLVKRATAQ